MFLELGVAAEASSKPYCPESFAGPIEALVTHILTDEAYVEKYGVHIESGPAYLLNVSSEPACTLGPASPVRNSEFMVSLASDAELDYIASQLGQVWILIASRVVFETGNRVTITLASGVLRNGIFSGCGGPAILSRTDYFWRFESWKPHMCS